MCEPTLRVFHRDQVIFESFSRWLHPLFELEEFLGSSGENYKKKLAENPGDFLVQDTVAGKAGAFLIVRLGFTRVKLNLASQLAAQVFDLHGITWTAPSRVERISCMTESALADQDDPDQAYVFLKARRTLALEKARTSAQP